MSFDLMLLEKSKAPKDYESFLSWTNQLTNWKNNYDYNSIDGTSENLINWFMEMKEFFPPLNGPFATDISDESENYFADYSLGDNIIYVGFAWSVADEAEQKALELADKHSVIFFNPQSTEINSTDMILCKMNSERYSDSNVIWEQIETEINFLDSLEYNSNFVTICFDNLNKKNEYMQCAPNYKKNLFSKLSYKRDEIISYAIEVNNNEKLYGITVASIDEIIPFFYNYYTTRKLPDLSNWHELNL